MSKAIHRQRFIDSGDPLRIAATHSTSADPSNRIAARDPAVDEYTGRRAAAACCLATWLTGAKIPASEPVRLRKCRPDVGGPYGECDEQVLDSAVGARRYAQSQNGRIQDGSVEDQSLCGQLILLIAFALAALLSWLS